MTVEEGSVKGGAGDEIADILMEKGVLVKIIKHGIPDLFVEHGDHNSLRKLIQLDAESILDNIAKNL